MRKRHWLMAVAALVVGLATGALSITVFTVADATCLLRDPSCEPNYNYDMDVGSVSMGGIGAITFMVLFMSPMIIRAAWNELRTQEETMARIESVKGTVKFDDECMEYDFITGVRRYPELQDRINRFIEEWETQDLVAEQIHAEVWVTTLSAIPQQGIHRHLFGEYLKAIDWHEIATYYIEQYEQEHSNDER